MTRWDRLRRGIGRNTRSAAVVSMLTAVSKGLGLVRELFLAWAFGTGAVVDALRIGLAFTTYFSHLFFGEAMTGAVVPRLARLRGTDTARPEATTITAGVTGAAIALTVPLGLVFILVPGHVIDLLVPDLTAEQRRWTAAFLPIFGLAIPLYSLTALAVMVRRAAADYLPLGFRPLGQNLFLLVGIALAYLLDAPLFLPAAFLVYYGMLVVLVDRGHLFTTLGAGWRTIRLGIRRVAARWYPLAGSLMLLRGMTLVERYFGSQLPTGSIAALDYARTLADLPVLLIGVPAGAVLMTSVSQSENRRLTAGQKRKLAGLVAGLVVASAVLVVFAQPITALIFQRGEFGTESSAATAAALRGLGIGTWAFALGHILLQYLMATHSPFAIFVPCALSLATAIAVAMTLVPILGLFGLALSTSAGAIAFVLVALIVAAIRPRSP